MSSKEQLLKEYAKLATAVANVNATVQEMNAVDINQVIAKIRLVERKMGVVYTIFRSSVYSVTKQTQDQDQDQDHGYEQGQGQGQEQLVEQDPGHEQERARNSMQYSREQDSLAQSQQQEDHYYHHGRQQQHNQEQYYHDQHDQELQQPQHERAAQTYELPSQRTSFYASNDGSNMPRSSRFSNATRLSGRTSNTQEEYQSTSGETPIFSASRGYSSGGSRWTQGRLDTDMLTNRPRYH
ncbi:hypothetical protein BGZ51_003116 [Haplosporangium sp. Z 767]|nr:hypothetical protein BGZ51_003116 [Haplosporangium sp. Z 767]KAF9195736.1 hypothetical protein BGZ50_003683 [Haplosporangium sp. Z 11]